MKQTIYNPNIWSYSPFAMHLLAQQDYDRRHIKEIIIKNPEINKLGISEMSLNIKKFTAIDKTGKEHEILDFPGQNNVNIKGLSSGHFLKSKNAVKLQPNTYGILRFYLGRKNNQFIYNDGVVETDNRLDFIDFEIEKGLVIKDDETTEVKIWFELAPYLFIRHFKPLIEWIKKSKQSKPKLSNCIQ